MQQRKSVDPKWITGAHYLSVVYRESANRGFKPINLSVTNAAEFMEHLARGTTNEWERGTTVLPKEERLTNALLNVIWSHGRKHNADDRIDMERLAERFLVEHRLLIAELALTMHEAKK